MLDYSEFTKRNHVTKAIRFELIPQENTLKSIGEKGDGEYDKSLYESLERLKPVIDSFIVSIMNKALANVDFDFEPMYAAIIEKNRKAREKEEKALAKIIEKNLTGSMPDGLKIAQINSAKFLQDALSEYVKHTTDPAIKKDEAVKDVETTKGCLILFNKFLITRITALTTWMPKRLVENFEIYISNIQKIENIISEGGELTDGIIDELSLMKNVSYYTQILSQKGIDGYNNIISGLRDENGIIVKGLNERVNEYNIKVRSEKLDKRFLRVVSPLYKLPLIPAEKKFKIESIGTDDEVRDVIKNTWETFSAASAKMIKLLEDKVCTSDGEGIFIQGNRVHTLSHLLTGEHKTITDYLVNAELKEINEILSLSTLKSSMRKELEKRAEIVQSIVSKKVYEFTELNDAVITADMSNLAPTRTAFRMYVDCVSSLLNTSKMTFKILEGGDIFKKRRIKGDRHVQELLVDFFGALTDIRDALSLIRLPEDIENTDVAFYNVYNELFDNIRLSHKAENLVRNYITKSTKDFAEEKQTCFGTPARLRTQWWNGEKKFSKDNAAIIKHDGKYYYFILAGDAKPIEIKEVESSDTGFLTLKKGQKSFMMLPKILFSDHAVPYYTENKDADEYIFDDEQVLRPVRVSREIYEIYRDGLFKREAVNSGAITEEQYKENIVKLIDTYKDFANAYAQYSKFNLETLGDSDSYADIGEFFSDVDTCTSNISWTNIDFKEIENLVHSGTGYLFLISNRFLYTGNEDKNTYTKTLLSILSEDNMNRTTMLLNSNPSVYFRPQAVEKKITHKIGSIMVNHLTEDGERIPNDIYETIYKMKNNISSVESKDVEKAKKYMTTHHVRTFTNKMERSYNERYMSDKYILQLTYTKNNDVSDRANDMLNDRVNEAINDGFNIVSVARSTNDMVYAMALDNDLNILEEKSLNVIDGMDYYALLHDAYSEKIEDKKTWIYTTDSADLKSAYVDLAITEILKLARKYNAVIVVESISDAVKDKYSFLDNQVFKAFENRIAQRLSDLTFKDILDGKAGSVSNPLQLANNSGNNYQDGILFFVNGAYTRYVDEKSGFTNLFDFSRINSIASKRQFFAKMENIAYDGESLVFKFDYAEYPVKVEPSKTKWEIKVSGNAVTFDKENKCNVFVDDVVNDVILPLAGKTNLDGNLADKIMDKEVPGVFVEELYKWFRYTLVGMHKKTTKSEEFYKSPVDGNEYNICHSIAYNLARKLLFRMEYAGEAKDFTKEWIDYIQA